MKPMPNLATDSIPTRHSLLARMKDWEDQKSWQDFFNTYWRLIYGVAVRAGLSATEAEEVVQETVLAVAKKIGEFRNEPALGSFKSWLMVITRRRIADQFRRRPPVSPALPRRPEETARTATIEGVPDPASLHLDSIWEEQWEENLLRVALENVKNRVSPKQFLLFQEQALKEIPAPRVARKYGLNLAQVYMARYRVSRLLKRELRSLRQKTS
jgi:RNA polymerase sigma-70 factor (ECF subfamily)